MANWLQNAAPTIGGIAGGVLGGIGGAVAAPFTGGIINPIDAGIAGAGLGGGLGQVVKNATTGQQALQGNVLESAAQNAVGQAAGEGLGLLAKPVLSGVGNLAEQGASKLLQGQFLKGAIDSGTVNTLRDMGVSDANQVGQIAEHITGSNGALPKGVLRGLQESNTPADLSVLTPRANQLLSENQMQLRGNSIPDIANTVQKALLTAVNPEDVTQLASRGTRSGLGQPLFTFEPGSLQNVLPENAFKLSQNFDQLASNAYKAAYDKSGAVINPDQLAKFNIFSGLADEVKHAAFGGDAGLPISEVNKAQILQELEPLKNINPQAYNYIVDKVSSAQNLQELRPLQKPLIDASRALNLTSKTASRFGGTTAGEMLGGGLTAAGILSGNPLAVAGGAAGLLAKNPAAERIGSSTLGRISDILTNPTVQKAVKGALPPAAVATANIPGYTLGNEGGNGMMPPTGMTTPMTPAASASPEALQMMLGLIGLQTDPYLASQFAPMITSATEPLQQASVAQSALQGLEGTYGQAGGGVGGMSGLLARLQSLIPGSAGNLYNRQSGQLEQTLQKLGVPGTALPSLLSGAPTSQAGFGDIQQIINSLGGNPQSVLGSLPMNG